MYEAKERAHLVSSILPGFRSKIGKVNHSGWMNKNPAQFLYNFPLDIFGRAPTIVAPGILSIGILHKFFRAILCILTIDFYPVM